MNSVPADAAVALACQSHLGSEPLDTRATRMRWSSDAITSVYRIMNAQMPDEHLWQAKVLEPMQEVGHGRGRGHDHGRRHAERALHEDVPHPPQAGDRQRQAEHLDALALPDDGEEQREREERHLDHEPAQDERDRDLTEQHQPEEDEREEPERPERLAWSGDDREHEQHGRRELALRREPVERRGARDVEVVVAAHVRCGPPPARHSHDRQHAVADGEGERDADDARQALAQLLVVHAVDAIAREGTAVHGARLDARSNALSDGDLVQPVGLRARVRAHEEGKPECHEQPDREEDRDSLHAATAGATGCIVKSVGAPHEIGPDGEHRGDRHRGDHALADADEHVHADHRCRDRADRRRAVPTQRVLER